MYHEKMLSVCAIANGYLIEVRAQWKKTKDDEEKERDCCCCVSSGMQYGEKEIYAKDSTDLAKKIELIIPMLDAEFGSESEFDAAFKVVK